MPYKRGYLRGGVRAYNVARRYYPLARKTYLRGSALLRRRSMGMRGPLSRPRAWRALPRKRMRKYKMYRRTVPSTRAKTKCINSGETGPPTSQSGSATSVTVFSGTTFNNVDCAMGRLYLKLIPTPTATDQTTTGTTLGFANQRRRMTNHVRYHGIKIDRIFGLPYNEKQPRGPMMVHWCIIQFRRNAYEQITTALPSELNLQKDFFRNHDDSDEGNQKDSTDFPAYFSATSWNHEMNVLPMNPDNNYRIITHRKFLLYPKDIPSGSGYTNMGPCNQKMRWNACNMKALKLYYKYGKVLTFGGVKDDEPENPIAELWWYNSLFEDDKPADVGVSPSFYLNTFCKNATYFSDAD